MNVGERPATRLWREALAQFDELLQLSPAQREQALTGIAQSQPQLHSMLISLLAAEAQASSEGFLEPPAARSTPSLHAGEQLGPYRLLSPIGAGGMGVVWLARRDDGLYEGEVAIKTLHPYFGGGSLRERFLREAQILGRLAHPNIARLLDAGVTSDGNVYLVLEYVRGQAIDAWCDTHRLDVTRRLRLFIDVCAAVAHAHANLIVHRDLKPSNILVTEDGRVKLLDFGVAKLVETDRLADRSELTRLTGRIFTPEYAAPEQVVGELVTTVTDVYSLGVLLHVLLTATRPYGASGNSVDIEHAVLHDEPVRASRAVIAGNAEWIAGCRSTTVTKLQRSLAGDLDNIIARGLRKTPSHRYASVLALAEDVRRHMDHEPILAQAESFASRARKFVRRHRVATVASGVVVLALTAGIAGVLWQAQVARAEARKATAIRGFLVGIFERNSVAHPDGAKARQTTAAELLAESARQIRSGLGDAPEVRDELLGVMSQLYASLDMQKEALDLLQALLVNQQAEFGASSLPVAKTLAEMSYSQIQIGDYAAAERSANDALRTFAAIGDSALLENALAHGHLAQAAYRVGDARGSVAREHFQRALDLIAEHHPRSKWRIEMLLGLSRIANLDREHEQSLRYCQQAIELIESNAVDVDGIVRGTVYQSTGNRFSWLSRNDAAERFMRKALVEYQSAGGPDHPFTIEGHRELGALLGWIGRRADAKQLLATALAAQERVKGADDPELTTYVRVELARVLLLRGEFATAEPHLVRAIEIWRRANVPTVGARMALALLQMEQGRVDEAARTLNDIEAAAIESFGKGSWMHATAINRVGTLQMSQGRLREAHDTFVRFATDVPEPPESLGVNRAAAEIGQVRLLVGANDASARAAAATLISKIESSPDRAQMPDEEAAARMLLGVALMRAGDVAGAEPHLLAAVKMREGLGAPESPWLAEARLYLAQQRHMSNKPVEARGLFDLAAAAIKAQRLLAPQYHALLAHSRKQLAITGS